jgi:parallel beta-helix repeat protein
MTTAALTPSKEYIENGVTTVFAVPFRFRSPQHIAASRVSAAGVVTALTYGADYSVTGGSTDAGGSLTVTAAGAAGTRLRIKRVTPRAQTMDYTTGDTFPAESHEGALDTAMLIDQEQDQKIDDTALRAVLVPDGETAGLLPKIADRIGKFFAWGPSGDPLPSSGTGADAGLRSDLASGMLGALLVAWKANGVGAVVRTLWAKIGDLPLNPKDFGAVGNYVADDTAAFQAAIIAGHIDIPPGIFKVSSSISTPSNRRISGAGALTIIKKNVETMGRVFVNSDPVAGNTGIVLEDFVVDGSRTSTAYVPLCDGIYLTRCSNSSISRVHVRNCLNDGIIDEYGSGNTITNCVSSSNAKLGFYWSGSDNPVTNGNVAKNNLGGGFGGAATWFLSGAGNVAFGNAPFDVTFGRDSRYCTFGCTVNPAVGGYAFFAAAETIGSGGISQVLHGKTYPGDATLYGVHESVFDLSGTGKIHTYVSDDNIFRLNMANSTSQGIVVFGSRRNKFEGSVRNWGAGFAGIQFVTAESINSTDNDYGSLRLYDATNSKTAISDPANGNTGFGAQRQGLVNDKFYETGIWTPTIAGSIATGTQTYSVREGSFIRIGRLVVVQCAIIMSAKDAATSGNISCRGLPFPAAAAWSGTAAISQYVFDLGAGYTSPGAQILAGSSQVNLTQVGDNVALINLDAVNLIASSRLYFTATYITD